VKYTASASAGLRVSITALVAARLSALRATERKPPAWSGSPAAAAPAVDQLPLRSLQGVLGVGKQMSTRQSIWPVTALSLSTSRLAL
jgi:hypothetical protein